MWNRPARNFDGWASANAYPWSETIFTRRPSIFPSSFSASSPSM